MQALEQKYQALLDEMQRRGLPGAEDIRLCFQTLSLAAAIDRDCAALLAPHGLSEGRFVMLFLLDAAGPEGLAPHQLAQRAGISRATVTGLLDGLERERLVERQPDAQDRRALRIQLTAAGQRLAQQVLEQHSRWIAGLFTPLDARERAQLAQLLAKVAAQWPAASAASTASTTSTAGAA
ncbi:MarR family transcriptional regulator [Comamonadaceae bacterium OH2545_COT-014]|nr:MarR family transcriptional regulator [Comamonadaceae bacterium OH2545_COT-014]